jgi:RNA polymerase sigma-70 factor, ECF subfamily
VQENAEHEIDLMRQAQRNPAAFEVIYERYADRIYRYCLRRTDDVHEAEDLTSVVFTKALATLTSYRGGMVSAWLFQIAHNAVTDHLRGRRPQVSLTDFDMMHESDPALDEFVYAEDVQRIRALLDDVPPEQRALLDLKLNSGLNSAEIGEIVGKSAVAVRSILHRLLRRLHTLYHAEEHPHLTNPIESEGNRS